MFHSAARPAFLLGVLAVFSVTVQAFGADEVTLAIPSGKTPEQIMEASRDAIVVIRQNGRDGGHEGIGTGFIISDDGLIATCLHVIGEARPVSVTFANGKTSPVTQIHAWDRKLDLAVIRVADTNLHALRLGDSDNLKPGASVVAIGNPRGLAHSIVQGVVSAMREFEFGPMIQLAIPIEPGNSGGPLLSLNGRVHGILSMKSAVTDNLGFAIPINALKPLLEHPNSVPLEKWLAIGALNEKLWQPIMGAHWRQKAGMITVDSAGTGFGGRSLCLWRQKAPDAPYEIAVTVHLDEESGAAGLVFGSDGGDEHFGFYPSAGQLRLTRFEGPNVFTWNILRQIDSPHYHPGEWNRLKVRIDSSKIQCFVNGYWVTEVEEPVSAGRLAGLAKFRDTTAHFRNFQIGKSVDAGSGFGAADERLRLELQKAVDNPQDVSEVLLDRPAAHEAIMGMARDWEQKAESARKVARQLNEKSVQRDLVRILQERDPDLFAASIMLARIDSPELEFKSYQEEIERMAEEARGTLPANASDRGKLDRLIKYLFEENGFHGSRSDYYNRANSFMNRVLDDREGIPITLSVLFLELGRKLGIEKLEGMPFPGHFMVRFEEVESEPLYVDVFDAGKLYKKSELYTLISNHSELPLREEHFRPATTKEIVIRMLHNVVGNPQPGPTRTLPYLDLLLALSPDDPLEHWRRASLRLQAGERAAAREDLQWLLDKKPEGLDLERIEELYRSLKEK